MSKLVKYIGEYFLGTETHSYYKQQRNFLREFCIDHSELKQQLIISKIG